MWSKCRQYVTGGVVGLIVALIISFCLVRNLLHIPKPIISTPEKTVVVRLVTKVDTVWKKQIIREYMVVDKPTLVQTDTLYKPGTHNVVTIPAVKRVYLDSVEVVKDSVTLSYKANVTGKLENIKLGFTDHRAQKTIIKTDSVFTTTTIKQYPGGLFVGLDAGYNQIAPGLQYVKDKNSFGVKYNLLGNQTIPLQNVQLQYSRRIW